MTALTLLLTLVAVFLGQTQPDNQGAYPLPSSQPLAGSVVAEISNAPA